VRVVPDVGGFAANGFGEHSPGGYSMFSALIAEVTLTFAFLMIILGSTDNRAPAGFAPIAMGLALRFFHAVVGTWLIGGLVAGLVVCGSNEGARTTSTSDAGASTDGSVEAVLDEGATADDSMSGNAAESTARVTDSAAATTIADASAFDAGRSYSGDRTLFFGASRCAQTAVQLCEDFESGSLDNRIWTVSGTHPIIDGVQHARGAKALHITQTGNGLSYIKETKTFPEPMDTYFGRAFVYFNSLPGPPMTYAHWTFVAASGTGVSGEIRVSGQFQNGKNLFGVGTDNRVDPMGTGDWTNSDNDPPGMPNPVPTKQWICIEWMHNGSTNETRLWWDGTEHPSLYTSSTVHGGNTNPYTLPKFTNVWLGWQEYQTSTEVFELWLDEIAIDTARIGCVL
jgi:hypothetical protein